MLKQSLLLVSLACASPAQAEEITAEDFVQSNVIATFYHELGHAVIDIERIPVFGQEEDAADVFAIYMIDALFEQDSAINLAYETAFGFLGEVEARERARSEIAWWAAHGPDEQRFYNTVCLFYGADPARRKSFAREMGLPKARAALCPKEYDLADDSWGPIIDELKQRGAGNTVRFKGQVSSLTADILQEEINELNKTLSLKSPLTVSIEACGEANAFFYPDTNEIVFCSEFEDHLFRLADTLGVASASDNGEKGQDDLNAGSARVLN